MNNIKFTFKEYFLKKNHVIFIFFLIYLFIGLIIFRDYGISFDENISRINGFVTLKYIINKFSIPLELGNIIGEFPNLKNYGDNIYGIVFDLPLSLLEILFGIQDTRNIYLLRHLATFLIFFSSTICFYNLINFNFENKKLAIIGVFFLILSPRIFANSFYNSKDIVFLSFFIFSIYFCIKALNHKTIKYFILASIFSALSSGLRVVGAYIPFLTIFFYYLNHDQKKLNISSLKFPIYFVLLFFIFLFLFWPYLWDDPLGNFIHSLYKFGNFPYDIYVLYLGDYIHSKYLPWHYFFVWFLITTPPLISLFIIIGIFYVGKKLFLNFIKIENNKKDLLWKNNKEMNELFIFLTFLIPIFLILLLNSPWYGGWRHLYFIYPALVFIGIKAIDTLLNSFNKFVQRLIYTSLFIQLLLVLNFLIQSHPLQFVYFNSLVKNFVNKRFDIDYWGVGNQFTLKKLTFNANYQKPIKVTAASFTDLNKTKLILKKDIRDKFIFLGSEKKEAKFIFTNYYYHVPPNIDKRYKIPEDFKSIIKLNVNGLLVNEVFERK